MSETTDTVAVGRVFPQFITATIIMPPTPRSLAGAPFIGPMSKELSVEVRGELIIVTQSGTSFPATYGLERDNPNILLLAASADPKAKPGEIYQFRADAFGTAMRMARELGRIV
jgi:hypothetical protein